VNEENQDFSNFEEDLIILLNKLSKTVDTFNTLSKDQAEKAILITETNINDCSQIIDKMEKYIKEHENDEEIDKNELNKKVLNYKSEYHDITNKFKEVKDSYINKKTKNALMEQNDNSLVEDDENKNSKIKKGEAPSYKIDGELIDDDNKNNNISHKKENEKKNKKEVNNSKNIENKNNKNEISLISVNNNKSILDHTNTQILDYTLNPKVNIETDETFIQINKDYDYKKKKIVAICVAICILIFLIIILSSYFS
jgi:hypothetical protein